MKLLIYIALFFYATTALQLFCPELPHPVQLGDNDVTFFLLTRSCPNSVEIQPGYCSHGRYDLKGWIQNAPLYIIVHGFKSSCDSNFGSGLSSALLHRPQDSNIVLVNWSKVACDGGAWFSLRSDYKYAVSSLPQVGAKIGDLIKYFVYLNLLTFEKVHYIGHSLGAQLGNYVARNLNGRIASIIGLDPAGPCFANRDEHERLDRSDALFVSVVHTHQGHWWQGKLGINIPSGHVDFYPNGGSRQPGCAFPWTTCNHMKAYELFIEAVKTPASFLARKCTSYRDFVYQSCGSDILVQFGLHVHTKEHGHYYFKTNGQAPFGQQYRGTYFEAHRRGLYVRHKQNSLLEI